MINKISRLFLLHLAILSSSAIAGGGAPPTIVQVDEAVDIEIAPFIYVSGTVIGRYDSKIAAEVDGTLKTVLEVGDRVNAGDIIAQVDDKTYQLALEQIAAEIKPIETMVEFHRREAERLEKLAEKNNAARNQLDKTQASRDEALANIRVVNARLAIARDNLNRTTVRAPFAGVVTERFKTQGERVDKGDQIVRLINTEKLEVQGRIQQQSYKYIKDGDRLTIKSSTGEEVDGIVRTVIPVGDDISRLYEIRVEISAADWPVGAAVLIATPVEEKQNVITVSRDALVIRQSGVVVYKINSNDMAELVPVKTGISNGTRIQVIGDIKVSDKIVVRGNERLRPGQSVKIVSGSNS
jgi:RND family efflux transporter MFP subunit